MIVSLKYAYDWNVSTNDTKQAINKRRNKAAKQAKVKYNQEVKSNA